MQNNYVDETMDSFDLSLNLVLSMRDKKQDFWASYLWN